MFVSELWSVVQSIVDKWSINPVSHPYPVYSHALSWNDVAAVYAG
jgi:hypothetical protein